MQGKIVKDIVIGISVIITQMIPVSTGKKWINESLLQHKLLNTRFKDNLAFARLFVLNYILRKQIFLFGIYHRSIKRN